MSINVYGNLIHKGTTEITVMHVDSPLYEPEKDANILFNTLRESLPPATFCELVALMKMCDPIPF